MSKYKVGQELNYDRGQAAVDVRLERIIKVKVQKVHTEEGLSQPLYTVAWPPRGVGTVCESKLSEI